RFDVHVAHDIEVAAVRSFLRPTASPSAHAHGLDHHQLALSDAVKDVSRTLSGHADVDFYLDVGQVRVTPSLRRRLRQHTASLDLKPGNIWQLGGGSGNARPCFDGSLLRRRGVGARNLLRRRWAPAVRRNASEHERSSSLLPGSEAHIAFVDKAD